MLQFLWGKIYSLTTQPLLILQKRAMRVMSLSKFHEHSSPISNISILLNCLTLSFRNMAISMYKFHNRYLTFVLDTFFTKSVKDIIQ